MIQFITDSSADLPKEIIEQYNIHVVPLNISVNNEDYLEGVDISPQKFFQKMFTSTNLPKTSQPSPSSFSEIFSKISKDDEALCFTISSGLSGTYQSACLGKDLSNSNVTIFDTLGGSLGHGIQILNAAQLAAEGLPLDKIIEKLKEYRSEMNILILLNTLENIVKGGRLSKFQGSVAKIFDIKVLLEGVEGKVEILEKIRGKKKFLQRVLDMIGDRKQDFSDTTFGITHVDNLKDAEFLKNEIMKRYNPKDIIINYMGATMATYAGKGGMIISFL
ncbi:DegV family EDD domain-containing protein [Clostridium bovifaecis]|uniref:DegV family EDD domain-containing protein n=1 Tax=Clostridium bovifaecis TaxID=2184719 RepID=A0A6I6ENY6_9CLOT|nr:DegV family EDD domain-containing protein [Clostridium bovifaecis]